MSEEEKEPSVGERVPSSPWPSARKSESPQHAASPAASAATDAPAKARWAEPLDRFDRAWTRFDSRLCAAVLLADVLTLVTWISLKSLSNTGRAGAGLVFRCMAAALVVGGITHLLTRKRTPRHELFTTIAVLVGAFLGSRLGDAGVVYFGNVLAWLQNASFLVFFGGASDIAKRLTLWLALLGASVATAQGKHINVDVVMRFLTPRARVPVAVLGWLVAAAVCFAGVWGFFDHVAVVDYLAPTTVPCAEAPEKTCPAPPGSKIDRVLSQTRRDLFLANRQISLDLETLPKVLGGTPYGGWLTPEKWNAWLREGGWEKHFDAADVKAMELEEGKPDAFRTPAVTAVPGGGERVHMLLVREFNFVVAFGLLLIALRFVLRSILAITGWVKVDPNAAHGDEELAHAHDPTAEAGHAPQAQAAPESS